MPYTNCPSCQLSVYAPRAAFSTLHHCPRCNTVLSKVSEGSPKRRYANRAASPPPGNLNGGAAGTAAQAAG